MIILLYFVMKILKEFKLIPETNRLPTMLSILKQEQVSIWSVWAEQMICICVGILQSSKVEWNSSTQTQWMCSPTQTDQTWTYSCFYSILK